MLGFDQPPARMRTILICKLWIGMRHIRQNPGATRRLNVFQVGRGLDHPRGGVADYAPGAALKAIR